MPKLKSPCRNYPCPGLASRRSGLCEPCQKKHGQAYRAARATDPAREDSFYHSPEWKWLRALKLQADPWCAECPALVSATTVDHVTPITQGGAALDIANLQSLCTSHHNAKTARERNYRGRFLQ